tara:strand:- start:28320 stop:30224 length:1905 start_codon:yes stop_codon:yes gene_type:complete
MRQIKRIAKFGFDKKSVFNPEDGNLPEDISPNIDDTPLRQESKTEAQQKVIAKLRAGRDANVSDVFSPSNTPKATTLIHSVETKSDTGWKDKKIIDTGQPVDTTSAKNLLSKFDDRIKLAEEVLNFNAESAPVIGSKDITIFQKAKWERELIEATQAKADYIAEVNVKSGWAGADDLIDVETEKKIRHQAFTTGVISDLNTSRPQDIAAMVDMKNTGTFTDKELAVANKPADPAQVGRDVQFATSVVEQGAGNTPRTTDLARDMHVEQMGIGNFHESTLEERAAVSGVEAKYEWVVNPKTGKKKRIQVEADLGSGGPKLGGTGGQDYKLSSKMSALVQGLGVPPSARTRSGMKFGKEQWTAEQTKFGIKDWEEAAAQHFGGKKTPGYKAYMETALTPRVDNLGVGQSDSLKELTRVHKQIIDDAVYRRVIKKDILSMAAGQPGYGHRTDWRTGIDIDKPKSDVTVKMTEAYFRGDFGESPIRNLHSAKIMGVGEMKGINVPLKNPTDTYFNASSSKFDRIGFSGALGASGEVSRLNYGKGVSYGESKAFKQQLKESNVPRVVVNNPDSSINRMLDDRPNTRFPKKDEVSSSRDARIRKNITKFKGGHRFIPGAIALKGIIGLHKGGGGAGKFSK